MYTLQSEADLYILSRVLVHALIVKYSLYIHKL